MNTLVTTYLKARSSNSTDANFASKVATVTAPSGTGVSATRIIGEFSNSAIAVVPFGAGADNSTFDLRILGWRATGNGLYVPTILCQVACTLSTSVGVAGADVLDTERFVDTLTLSLGNAGVDCQVFSPANDTPSHVIVDTKGVSFVEFLFDMGTATSGNALFAFI